MHFWKYMGIIIIIVYFHTHRVSIRILCYSVFLFFYFFCYSFCHDIYNFSIRLVHFTPHTPIPHWDLYIKGMQYSNKQRTECLMLRCLYNIYIFTFIYKDSWSSPDSCFFFFSLAFSFAPTFFLIPFLYLFFKDLGSFVWQSRGVTRCRRRTTDGRWGEQQGWARLCI